MGAALAAAKASCAPSLRSLPVPPLAAAAATAVALGALAAQTAPVISVRLAAVVLAAGAALAIPDPAAPTVEAVPVPRWVRAVVRLAPLFGGWAVAWAARGRPRR